MTRLILVALVAAVALTGCGSGANSTDPKPAAGAKADPRLKQVGHGPSGNAPTPKAAGGKIPN